MTTKTRYAVRALSNLILRDAEKAVPLSEIAKEEEISLNFLEQIFMCLRKAGIVKSVRGPTGGYILNRDPKNITLADIFRSVGEPMVPIKCVDDYLGDGKSYCPREEYCLTRNVWLELCRKIDECLIKTTMAEIIKKTTSSPSK